MFVDAGESTLEELAFAEAVTVIMDVGSPLSAVDGTIADVDGVQKWWQIALVLDRKHLQWKDPLIGIQQPDLH